MTNEERKQIIDEAAERTTKHLNSTQRFVEAIITTLFQATHIPTGDDTVVVLRAMADYLEQLNIMLPDQTQPKQDEPLMVPGPKTAQ